MTTTDPTGGHGEARRVRAADFRHAIGHFATGVTVVTSVGIDGQPVGTTANAVSSLSLDPPLILVCFDRSSQTLEAVLAHGAFAVNVLGARQQHLSANFARRGPGRGLGRGPAPPGPDRQPTAGRTCSPASKCTVEHRLDGGDHEIVVGRVREVETSGDDAAPLRVLARQLRVARVTRNHPLRTQDRPTRLTRLGPAMTSPTHPVSPERALL